VAVVRGAYYLFRDVQQMATADDAPSLNSLRLLSLGVTSSSTGSRTFPASEFGTGPRLTFSMRLRIWAFGRPFENGRSVKNLPEHSLSSILGLCTSAPAAPMRCASRPPPSLRPPCINVASSPFSAFTLERSSGACPRDGLREASTTSPERSLVSVSCGSHRCQQRIDSLPLRRRRFMGLSVDKGL
jgi:hypothetical protein